MSFLEKIIINIVFLSAHWQKVNLLIVIGITRIAIHTRNYKKHDYTTLAEHMPEPHQSYLEAKGWVVFKGNGMQLKLPRIWSPDF